LSIGKKIGGSHAHLKLLNTRASSLFFCGRRLVDTIDECVCASIVCCHRRRALAGQLGLNDLGELFAELDPELAEIN
jgi:hypothetical protein